MVRMQDFWDSYGIFLAEVATVVLAIVAVLAVAAYLLRRGRRVPDLMVEDLGQQFDALSRAVRARLVSRAQLRREARQSRAQRKAERAPGATRRPRMFVLDFHGDPRATEVGALREEITAIVGAVGEGDEVLLRLENGGGLVHEQGLAASQLLRLRSRGIPLTVAVDKVAASGGYMMACVAGRVVAAPFAVLGSIGVVTVVPNVRRLLDRYGVDVEEFTGGRFKRTVTTYGENTAEDRAKLTEEIEDTHALFKDFVAAHRPQVDVEQVGTGEHWYGARAVDLGLVDEIITSDDYLLAARQRFDLYHLRSSRRAPRRRIGALLASVRGAAGLG
jgi:serine protease SohB